MMYSVFLLIFPCVCFPPPRLLSWSFFLISSLPPSRNSDPRSHIHSRLPLPSPPWFLPYIFYRDRASAVSSLVDSRRIAPTYPRYALSAVDSTLSDAIHDTGIVIPYLRLQPYIHTLITVGFALTKIKAINSSIRGESLDHWRDRVCFSYGPYCFVLASLVQLLPRYIHINAYPLPTQLSSTSGPVRWLLSRLVDHHPPLLLLLLRPQQQHVPAAAIPVAGTIPAIDLKLSSEQSKM